MKSLSACIFDLDGVIVDTAKYHFLAWQKIANQVGISFSEEDNELLKGISRIDSLNKILELGGVDKTDAEKQELCRVKNDYYLDLVGNMDESEILPGVVPFLDSLDAHGIPYALGSASKNAPKILELIGLKSRFKVIIDGNGVSRSKPDPEVFDKGATAMNVSNSTTVVFEDSQKGIEAALAGGFLAVGIGSPEHLGEAHIVVSSFEELALEQLTNDILKFSHQS